MGSVLSAGGFCVRGELGIGTSWAQHPVVLRELARCLLPPYIPLGVPGRRLQVEEAFCQMHGVASAVWCSRRAVLSEMGRSTHCIVVCGAGRVVSTSLAPTGSPTSSAVLSVHVC